jgi:hypothetical protein
MQKYVKIGKGNGKRKKRKGFPLLAGPGGDSAQQSAGARGSVGRRPTWPASGGTARGQCRGREPTCQRGGERTEREMCPWAISKYFGDLVSNTSA